MRKLRFVSVFVLLAFVIAPTPAVTLAHPSQGWYTTTAYQIAVAYYDPLPHWAAFFSGHYGRNQHYLGPGGDGATECCDDGIANWDWYPSTWRDSLLLPKTWLFVYGGSQAWLPANYQAEVFH
ncbi:MAG: hypothetical protein CEE40_13060 [Chloroflexi bacterium B3_Chlor]|nr:MAG: hypothetical protein CEE40_13060 [Chloroflexi bacterium B3_Chlor]